MKKTDGTREGLKKKLFVGIKWGDVIRRVLLVLLLLLAVYFFPDLFDSQKHCNAPDGYGDWGLNSVPIPQNIINKTKQPQDSAVADGTEFKSPPGKEQGHPKIYPCDDNDQEYGLYGCWSGGIGSSDFCGPKNNEVGKTVGCFSLVVEDESEKIEDIKKEYADGIQDIIGTDTKVDVTHNIPLGSNGYESLIKVVIHDNNVSTDKIQRIEDKLEIT